jgi:hypothetical protein
VLQKKTIMVTQDGKKVLLMGTCNYKCVASNLDGFTSALSALHTGLGFATTTGYFLGCKNCLANSQKEVPEYCCVQHDPGEYFPRTKGNVICSEYFKATKTFISLHSDHTVKRCGQLRPSEMRQIALHCINSGSKFKVSIFVCLLLAVELFLRKEEFRGVDFDSFANNMMMMSDEFVVEGLVLLLKKNDWKFGRKSRYVNLFVFLEYICLIEHLFLFSK